MVGHRRAIPSNFFDVNVFGLFSFVLSFSLIIAMAAYMALTFAIQSVTFKAIFK